MRYVRLLLIVGILAALALGSCAPNPPDEEPIPTLAVLASRTPVTPSDVPPTLTDTVVPTASPTETDTLETPEVTEVARIAAAPSETPTETVTPIPDTPIVVTGEAGTPTYITFTPSDTLDVTYTPGPTRTPTRTRTAEPEGLGLLALLSGQFTVLPPELRYNPPTLTALANAVTQQALNPAGGTPTTGAAIPTGQPPVGNPLATLPPPPITCAAPPPTSISALLGTGSAQLNALGCPIGSAIPLSTAYQSFERGAMLYVTGSPGDIYILFADGRYRRTPDPWIAGVDPESGGEIPPPGRYEPVRGFGKVWRTTADVRNNLGWGATPESGATADVLYFTGGRAIYLPQRNESLVVIEDAGSGGAAGTWRTLAGRY